MSMGDEVLWITRVPATIKMPKKLLDTELMMEECPILDIHFMRLWRECKLMTFEKRLKKAFKKYRIEIKELKKEEFACEEDAEKAVQRWIKKHPRCLLESLDISTVSCRVNGKRGRPKKGEELKTSYVVNPKIIPNETFIQKEKEKLGKFIRATNDLSLDPEQVLEYYKDQNNVERSFRF